MNQFYEDVMQTLTSWAEGLAASIPNILAALAVVTLFALVAGPLSRLISGAVRGVSESAAISRLSGRLSRYGIILAGTFVALGILGLDKTVTSLLAGAGVVGIALGFAFQDIAANFVAGVTMGIRHPFSIGDVIETNGFMGHVRQINLRSTVLETFDGQQVIVPNKDVFTNSLTNFYATGLRRVELEVGISYDDDIEKACELAKAAVSSFDFLAEGKSVDVIANGFGGSSIDLKVLYWIAYPGDTSYLSALHHGIVAVKKAFDAEGIEIPFPIRTLQLGEPNEGWKDSVSEHIALVKRDGAVNGESRAEAS